MQDDHAGLLSRRRLLETGAVAAASLTLLDSSAFASVQRLSATPKTTDPAPLSYTRKGYRRSRFAPHVGTTVKLRPHGAAAVRAQLAAVEDVAHVKGLAGASDAYVLRFRGPSSQPLAEGIVGVRHRDFGTLQLYITPTAPDGPNQDYLAAINRRIPRRERSAAARRR
ncbi:MAG: hypothetical protein QOE31_911 [Solirubrobacteraceae bacterium]|nr:hypothetical protein [Solirubrobacteraceae bacterium]